jgi:hypothetical protein
MPRDVSPPLVAATTSDLSRSWFIVLFYTDRRKENSNKLRKWLTGTRGAAFSSDDDRVDE